MTSDSVKILEILAEGGSLTLVGRQTNAVWRYGLLKNELALTDEGGGLSETPAETWEDALRLLERYPWRRLHTHYVHPDFAERVEAARKAPPAANGRRR